MSRVNQSSPFPRRTFPLLHDIPSTGGHACKSTGARSCSRIGSVVYQPPGVG